ncbi:hypothetical protein ACEWY4_027660 [Coilia grayii]|uniref:Na(+)/H(+) exchange regulatory cofactor NHE-RF1 n=1 Tax=Coilia grayii TaxID=363190 RepID=A0ABD1IPH3_9TELE
MGSTVEGSMGSTVEGTMGSTVEGGMGSTVEGSMGSTVEGTEGSTVEGSMGSTVEGTMGSTVEGGMGSTVEGSMGSTVEGTEGSTVEGSMGSTVEGSMGSCEFFRDVQSSMRPRLCVIEKGPGGYGFNLHSEKSRPGQYVRAVDQDSPAQTAGLLQKDRIIEVNGVSVEGKQHSQVVSLIRSGGEQTSLLVVDPDTDLYFKRCRVTPSREHLTGPLPEPLTNGDMEEKANGKVAEKAEPKVSVSPSPSNASSNASLSTPPTSTPPPEVCEAPPSGEIPALSMSLAQVKELAHQKRSQKRAPPMDWSKKNELFSNL